MIPSFAQRQKEWSSPPVDDIGYLPAEDLLAMDDATFAETMTAMWHNRYEGWRNYRGRWVELFGLARAGNDLVLDFGCGTGLEAAQFANEGHRVWLADISDANVEVAKRTMGLYGLEPAGTVKLDAENAFVRIDFPEPFDLIHCVGVLHHIPEPVPVMQHFHEILGDNGRVNLMVYSERAWQIATRRGVPRGDVVDDPNFEQFWRTWDAVGGYADWYSPRKLTEWFGEWFQIAATARLTADGAYLGAVLVKR